MKRQILIAFGALALSGCVASNLTQLTQALAKDPATACIQLSTPYGSASVVRTNPQNIGVDITATSGSCNVKSATKAGP